MRTVLALAGVASLGWLVAGQVGRLPSSDNVGAWRASAEEASGPAIRLVGTLMPPEPVVVAVAAAAEVPEHASAPQVLEPEASALVELAVEKAPQRTNPVALVSLDANTSRFPSRPSDPIGYALVLPASSKLDHPVSETRWWERDGAADVTGDLMHLRSKWPNAVAALAPSELPSSPSSASVPAAPPAQSAEVPAAPAEVAAEPTPQVASAEVPSTPAAAETRGLPSQPADTETAARPSTAPATTTPATTASVETAPPMPPVRTGTVRPAPRNVVRAAPAAGTAANGKPRLPPPPSRRLAAATPVTTVAEGSALICPTADCGQRLILLGVGF
jgi:hypothetical protein